MKMLCDFGLETNNIVTRVDLNIEKIGVYKARYGEFYTFDINEILTKSEMDNLVECFSC